MSDVHKHMISSHYIVCSIRATMQLVLGNVKHEEAELENREVKEASPWLT